MRLAAMAGCNAVVFTTIIVTVILKTVTASLSKPSYICHKCVCTVLPFGGSEYLDVVCDASVSAQSSLHLSEFSEADKTRSLRIENYAQVGLGVLKLAPSAHVFLRNILALHMDGWAEGASYSISGIGQLLFSENIRRANVRSIKLKNVTVPYLRSGALAFTSVTSKFIADAVDIGDIDKNAIVLPMDFNLTYFLLNDSQIRGKVAPGAGVVRAAKVVVSHCHLGPGSAAGLRLTASSKLIVSHSNIFQTKPAEFFDAFSPIIILIKNKFIPPPNASYEKYLSSSKVS